MYMFHFEESDVRMKNCGETVCTFEKMKAKCKSTSRDFVAAGAAPFTLRGRRPSPYRPPPPLAMHTVWKAFLHGFPIFESCRLLLSGIAEACPSPCSWNAVALVLPEHAQICDLDMVPVHWPCEWHLVFHGTVICFFDFSFQWYVYVFPACLRLRFLMEAPD